MKKTKNRILVLIGIIATSSLSMFAQTNQFTMDENGNGTFNGTPLTYSVSLDPSTGMSTLSYDLPFAGTPGVLIMTNNAESGSILSDLLVFDGNFHLFFYSDTEGGTNTSLIDLADVGIPTVVTNPGSITVAIAEVGPEGNNGGIYAPAFNFQPGTDPTGVYGPNVYNIISDVPEPATVVLSALGAATLLLIRRRK